MIRISTIFIAICMVLVAASLGLILYSMAGIGGTESAIVALTALTFLILYNAVSMRLRDRTDVGSQIADLSRGTADLARQVAEFGRRLAAVEGRVVSANSAGVDRIQSVVGEINELGSLVKQLAATVETHEEMLAAGAPTAAPPPPAAKAESSPQQELPAPAGDNSPVLAPAVAAPNAVASKAVTSDGAPARSHAQLLAAVRSAIEENRVDIYLQPMVSLPQRKVRFYEAVTRLRDEKDQILAAEDFIGTAENAGLIGRIDHMVMLRCVQVLRRLMVRNKDVGVFCNVAAATLGNTGTFSQCLDFLEANRRWRRRLCWSSSRRHSAISGRPRSNISPRWRSAATASRSIMSPTCGSSRANSPTAASGTSRCRLRCCSIRSRPRRRTFTPPTCPICSAVSAST